VWERGRIFQKLINKKGGTGDGGPTWEGQPDQHARKQSKMRETLEIRGRNLLMKNEKEVKKTRLGTGRRGVKGEKSKQKAKTPDKRLVGKKKKKQYKHGER